MVAEPSISTSRLRSRFCLALITVWMFTVLLRLRIAVGPAVLPSVSVNPR